MAVTLTWGDIEGAIGSTLQTIKDDGTPEILIAIGRGGLVPGVILSHRLNISTLLALRAHQTGNDFADIENLNLTFNTSKPMAALTGKDVLIVDDICTTGMTMMNAYNAVLKYNPRRIRCFACICKTPSVDPDGASHRKQILSYFGLTRNGWVVFPWEASM